MVLSGDWLSPQIYGHYWYDKPIFFYWMTALAYKMFGFTEFASRFFPALFGLGSVALLAWGGSKLENARSGFISALVLLSSVEFFSDQQVGNYRCCIVLFLQCDIAVFLSWLS